MDGAAVSVHRVPPQVAADDLLFVPVSTSLYNLSLFCPCPCVQTTPVSDAEHKRERKRKHDHKESSSSSSKKKKEQEDSPGHKSPGEISDE